MFHGNMDEGDPLRLGAPVLQLLLQAACHLLGGAFIQQGIDLIVIGLSPLFRQALQGLCPLPGGGQGGEGGHGLLLLFLLGRRGRGVVFALFLFCLLAGGQQEQSRKAKQPERFSIFFHPIHFLSHGRFMDLFFYHRISQKGKEVNG